MWPAKGQIWASRRRAENRIAQFSYTMAIYGVFVFVAAGVFSGRSDQKAGQPGHELAPPLSASSTDGVYKPQILDKSQPSFEQPHFQQSSPKYQENATVAYYANIRVAPDKSSDLVGRINAGERIIVTEIAGDWVKIERGGAALGWVHKSLVISDSAISR